MLRAPENSIPWRPWGTLSGRYSSFSCYRGEFTKFETVNSQSQNGSIVIDFRFRSDDVLQVEQGSLYPALHRLIKRRWISAEEGTSENTRRAKFYALTVKGRRQLAVETGKWEKLARAIAQILRPGEKEEA